MTMRASSSRPASDRYLQQAPKYTGLGYLKEIWVREGNKCLGSEIWVPLLTTPLKSGMTWARDITFLIMSVFIFGTTSSYPLPRVFVNINYDSD